MAIGVNYCKEYTTFVHPKKYFSLKVLDIYATRIDYTLLKIQYQLNFKRII